jgi:hypothetical protein
MERRRLGKLLVRAPTVTGHQEPSKHLHKAREKTLDVQNDAEKKYPRQGENKPGFTREKRKGRGSPGAISGTTKRGGRRGQVKKAKPAKKANRRNGGAR